MPELPGGPSEAAELRALGEEWRGEWPDGRVCKAELNRIADRIAERDTAIRADQTRQIAEWVRTIWPLPDGASNPSRAAWADAIARKFGGDSDAD